MPEDPKTEHSDKSGDADWFQRNVNLLIWCLVGACAATLFAELVFSPFFDDHHPAHFKIENVFGYQAVLGFVAFVCVVFLGKLLRLFVQRPEDYYDE